MVIKKRGVINMDLKYIVKGFKLPKSEHIVDSAQISQLSQQEIHNITQRLISIEDTLSVIKSRETNEAPEYFDDIELSDEEIVKVRTYLLEISDKYFPDIPLSKTMKYMFIWNIPRPVYETFEYCLVYGYPDVLNPMFWLFVNCLNLTPGLFCGILKHNVSLLDEETIEMADKIIDEYFEKEENEDE